MKKLLIVTAFFGLVACNKNLLDKHSLTSLSSNTLYKSYKDAQIVVNGIYDVLQNRDMYSGSTQSLGPLVAGLPMYDGFSDNCWNRIRAAGPGFYVAGGLTPTANIFSSFWSSNYSGIARCNEAIFNISKMLDSQIPADKKDALLSQAYFLRGLFYFNIAVYYESAPLILTPQTLQGAAVPKNTQREILDQVVKDLTTAEKNLPVTQTSDLYGYATKGAALGLLSRVYLFDKKWNEAANAAKAVIDLNQYNLNSPYETQFTYAGEKLKDVVFSVRFQEAVGFNTNETFSATLTNAPKVDLLPMPNCVNDFYCIDGKPITSSPLYNAANPKLNRDPRLLASVWFRGDVFITDINAVFKGNETGYGLKKYVRTQTTPSGATTAQPGGQDFYVIRYADVLLMRAEALIELGNTGTEVYSLINQIRDRVKMPHVQAVEGTGLSQVSLRNVLRHERRVELAFEGLRFFDIKRWGIVKNAYDRMTVDKILAMGVLYQGRKSETFPIPQSELDANKNLIQNDEWK